MIFIDVKKDSTFKSRIEDLTFKALPRPEPRKNATSNGAPDHTKDNSTIINECNIIILTAQYCLMHNTPHTITVEKCIYYFHGYV
jgi:hypothetical protein